MSCVSGNGLRVAPPSTLGAVGRSAAPAGGHADRGGDGSPPLIQREELKRLSSAPYAEPFSQAKRDGWARAKRAENARLSAISRAWLEQSGEADGFRSLMCCGLGGQPDRFPEIAYYGGGRGGFQGLTHCGSAWACPECAGIKLWKRSGDVSELLRHLAAENRERNAGYTAILLTLTVPHRPGMPLKNLMGGFSRGFSHLMNSRSIKGVRADFGYCCSVRCFDITVRDADGRADWHPHIHALLVFKGTDDISGVFEDGEFSEGATEAFRTLCGAFWGQWADKSVKKCFDGLPGGCSVSAFGFETIDLVEIGRSNEKSAKRVAGYVAKVVGTYIAGSSKVSRAEDRYTPFELLSRDDGREDFRRRAWVEYVEATKGFKRISFSAGWRPRTGYHEKQSDKLEKTDIRWSFEPSDRLVFLLRQHPEIRREAMRLASDGLPVDMLVLLDASFGGYERARTLSPSPLSGSKIVDYGGLSPIDKKVLSSLCGVRFSNSSYRFSWLWTRLWDGVPMREALRYREAVANGTEGDFVIDDLAVDYEEL